MGGIVWSILFQYNHIITHLVPIGTPSLLIPVIAIIETIRRVIRPGTLSIRLAGHLLLTLIGSLCPRLHNIILLSVILGLILLLILELAVACIQSYVFTILSSLYLDELLSTSFNKKYIYVKYNMSP